MKVNGQRKLGWGARGLTVALASLFFISLLTGVMPLPRSPTANVSAQDFTSYADATLDGTISQREGVFNSLDTTGLSTPVGGYTSFLGGTKYWMRTYTSFDTSSIPDDAVIQQVTLKYRVSSGSHLIDFNVQVYRSEYVTLDAADWDDYSNYQGVLLNTASAVNGNWYSLPLMVSSLNKTGETQFCLKSDNDPGLPTSNQYLYLYSGDSLGSEPLLEVWYSTLGTHISLELDAGGWTSWLNSTAFPIIQSWNLTFDLWELHVKTVPNSKNASVEIQNVSWEFQGINPICNYSLSSTLLVLEDVYDNLIYSIYFTVPKVNPYSTVHLSLYNPFTGEGFSWEMMKVQICDGPTWNDSTAETVAMADFFVEPERNYTIRVLDYFDNALIDYPFSANAQDVFISLAVPYYSWQIFNMNDSPALMRVYWNNSGSPWEFFVGPHWIIERFLKGGNYTFMVTTYDINGVAGETVTYDRTVPLTGLNASFTYISGTTLYEIVSSVEGVMARQQIITNLISPSVVLIYDNLPIAPAKLRSLSMLGSVTLDPYLVLETMTFQNGSEAAGTNITMGCPYPNISGGSYTILTDVLTFAGPYASWILVNTSAGISLAGSTSLPASLVLHGATNITIWSNQTVTASRATSWREVSEFTVNYYATEKKYVVTLSFNNSMTLDYYAPYWYIGFPADVVVDPTSVSVWDLDNDIPLSIRTNFEISSGGIHMSLPYLNASQTRNFRITYWDLNGTTQTGAPNLIADSYISKTLGNSQMKYTSVQWVNPWPQTYQGEIYISFNFTYGDSLLQSSITVMDENTGIALSSSDWLYTGRTLLILTSGVGVVGIGQGCNFGIYFTLDTDAISKEKSDFFFDAIVIGGSSFYIGGMGVSLFLVAIAFAWVIVGYTYYRNKDWFPIFVCVLSATIIGFYLKSMLT